MARQFDYTQTPVEIDANYERQVGRLVAIEGNVSDYPIAEARPERRTAIAPKQTFLPGRDASFITAEETGLIGQTQQAVGQMMQWATPTHPDTSHTRQVDSAVTVAWGSVVASAPMLGAIALTNAGLILVAWSIVGGAGSLWAMFWLIISGGMGLYALICNRKEGLHHSSSGIAHHALDNQAIEIQEKYQTARFAINRTFEFVEDQRKNVSTNSQ